MTDDKIKFQVDKATIDADAQITETAEYLAVGNVTLIREGVYPYDDGQALKPGDELAKGAEISRMYLAWDHPPFEVITHPREIKGYAEGINSRTDEKNRTQVKARLVFNKKTMTDDQAELIRSKTRRDVSIGFYCRQDHTPGTWNGQRYDYIQREFVFDHVASVDHGRCPSPICGIGVDANLLNRREAGTVTIGNDPYPNEHSCRIKDPDTFQKGSFRRIKQGKVSVILARPKGSTKMEIQAIRYPTSEWTSSEASANCKDHGGSFEAASDNFSLHDTPGTEKFPSIEVNLRPAAEDGEDNCEHCIFLHWEQKNECTIVEGQVAGTMICDQFTSKPTLERWVLALQRGNASIPVKIDAKELRRFVSEVRKLDRPDIVALHQKMHGKFTSSELAENPNHDAVVAELHRRRRELHP